MNENTYNAFHGTSKGFRAFKIPKTGSAGSYRLGLHFTDSQKHASLYAKWRDGPKPRTIEVTLTINNPFDIHALADKEVIDLLPLSPEAKRELRSAFRGNNSGAQYGLLEAAVRFNLRDALKAEGYDGIIYREGPGKSYIVFSSEQVKMVRSIKEANYFLESASSDVSAYRNATNIRTKLIQYMMLAQHDEYCGFKARRFSDGKVFLTIDSEDIGLTDNIMFRFGKMTGYVVHGHLAKFQNAGTMVIDIFCLDDAMNPDEASHMVIYRKDVHMILLHEITHYLDSFRNKAILDKQLDSGSSEYFNHPAEFNAFFTNMVEPLVHFLSMTEGEDADTVERIAKGMGISTDFAQNLKLITSPKAATSFQLKKFYESLSDRNRKAFLKRLHGIHSEVVKRLIA